MDPNNELLALEAKLDSFDSNERKNALDAIGKLSIIADGTLVIPEPKPEVNLHFHTFFSYNAESWSPSRIAWEAKKYGLCMAGIVDFDVLDGMEEFLSSGFALNLPVSAAMETRVFVSDFADKEMTSPNEPGITYFMAGGCYKLPCPDSTAGKQLAQMREMARKRNLMVMEKVNAYLDLVQINYDADVVPLTPSGNATERHMLAAYDRKSREVFSGNNQALVDFWAKALEISAEEAAKLVENEPKFHDKIRSKLMKFGGVGYIAPSKDTFPDIEPVISMINDIDALPMATWLDGTSEGEQDMPKLLEMLESKGVVSMNIIPDRNWNIKNPDEKAIKVRNLELAVNAAKALNFPLCVGTEMNKAGLPFVDNFNAPELQPFVQDFLSGAQFLWGHTFMARYADAGAASEWANSAFGSNRKQKLDYYTKLGKATSHVDAFVKLNSVNVKDMTPEQVANLLGC